MYERYKIKFVVKSKIQNPKPKIVIVGGGPAGSSLAIRLANFGFEVCLIEREKFPRQKLCGEFISPECLEHFRDLDVLDEMLSVGANRIAETVFYEPGGKSVSIPSAWFGANLTSALSISRAEMDLCLMEKAKVSGVQVFEETAAVGLLFDDEKVCGVRVTRNGETKEITADLIVDATGRANVLASFAKKFKVQRSKSKKIQNRKPKIQNRLVGFKTHLENVRLEKSRCEIYSFPGGYGGLSFVENDLANHCFLINASVVKEFSGDVDKIVENVIFQNKPAFEALKNAKPIYDWLAVSVDEFGAKDLNPMPNLFTVGDASAFIDPFTGSGILMGLEGAEILANAIAENLLEPAKIARIYERAHREKFRKRLLVCSLMRKAAYVPRFAKSLISVLNFSETACQILTRSTREAISVTEK